MRTRTSFILSGLVLALGLGMPGAVSTAPAQTRPNVVVIHTDDQDAASMAVMPRTRALVGAQGATFVNSFASFPLCCPSRATFLTGQYAHNHGVLGNNPPKGGFEKLRGANTLAVWLRRSGYHTALVGKYLNGYGERNPREIPPGWSDWNGAVDPSTYQYYATTINRNGRLVTTGRDAASYQTDVLRAAGQRHRPPPSAPRQQPFFLWTDVPGPARLLWRTRARTRSPNSNVPIPLPVTGGVSRWLASLVARASTRPTCPTSPSWCERCPRWPRQRWEGSAIATARAWRRCWPWTRRWLGSIAALRASGELNRTLILFTSDNGSLQGEHRLAGASRCCTSPRCGCRC